MSEIVRELKSVRDYLQENPIENYTSTCKIIVSNLSRTIIPAVELREVEEKRAAELAEFSPEIHAAAERGWNKLRELNPKFDGAEYTSFGVLPHPKRLDYLRLVDAAFPKIAGWEERTPRVFETTESIPADVVGVVDRAGQKAFRAPQSGWWWSADPEDAATWGRNGWTEFGREDLPVTEIV